MATDHFLTHDFEVTEDWHRPADDESEWRVSQCSCGQVMREGRAPTGLRPERDLLRPPP